MKIIADITHPAHVHFFRNAIDLWRERGHEVFVTSRNKDINIELLDAYKIQHIPLSTAPKQKTLPGFAWEMAQHCSRLALMAKRIQADRLVQIAGTFIAPVGRLLGIPAIVFYDTEFATLSNKISYPLAHAVCVPECYQGSAGRSEVRYPGYHELAYLHPNRFTPDPEILQQNGINPKDKIFLIRFVGWAAAHDYGESGLKLSHKIRLIQELSKRGRVLISSESELPEEIAQYKSNIPYKDIHHIVAHSWLVAGESATMASEAAVLGVPGVFISKTGRGYTDEQEKTFGLVKNFTIHQQEEAIQTILNLADNPDVPSEWQKKRQIMLNKKIDVTAWMVEFVENFKVR